jgi:pyridoxamine 5'-phosphate oxidase
MNRHSETRKEYLFSKLDHPESGMDPLEQFSRWYGEAVAAKTEEPNAMILSTSGKSGIVSARVVLLKGVERNGFVFFTNYDSRKGEQLAYNPRAALTFFWPKVERQVRVEGKVVKVSRRESNAYFNSRPLDSRISACVSPQSSVIPDRSFLEAMREGFILDLDDQEPECPPNWGGYLLKPSLIEFWQGRAHRLHDRIRFRKKGALWTVERLAP